MMLETGKGKNHSWNDELEWDWDIERKQETDASVVVFAGLVARLSTKSGLSSRSWSCRFYFSALFSEDWSRNAKGN
jgi:hypothetical protein